MMHHLSYLKNAYKQGKLAHAYLLSGNDATRKEAVIEGFMGSLIDHTKSVFSHPDVALVGPEQEEITIDQIRSLKAKMAQTAWQLPLKIVVLKKAERMNQEAQSAFLKLLEEPKGSSVFFLETEHAGSLLDTIRSRSQELRFYSFTPTQPAIGRLLSELSQSSLAERFAKAKAWGEDAGETETILTQLEAEGRARLLKELRGNLKQLSKIREFLALVRQGKRLIQKTQVNKRLTLERIFLELP